MSLEYQRYGRDKSTLVNSTYALYIGEFLSKGFSEHDAQIKVLEEIKANYEIDFWEVLL